MGEITPNGFSPPFTPLMPKITTLLTIFETTLSKTSLRQMAIIITATLRSNGRVAMSELSR